MSQWIPRKYWLKKKFKKYPHKKKTTIKSGIGLSGKNVNLMISDCLTCPQLYNPQSLMFLRQLRESKWALSKKQDDWLKGLHRVYVAHIIELQKKYEKRKSSNVVAA